MDPLQLLDEKGEEAFIWRYIIVATLSLLVYEYLITIDGEVTLIWSSQCSLPKMLFFLNRYLPMVAVSISARMLVTDTGCKTLLITTSTLACSCYIFAEATLFIRVYAIWERKRTILILLCVIFAGAIAGVYSTTALFLASTAASPIRLFHSGCFIVTSSRIMWVALVILVCCETAALSLLLIGVFFYRRNAKSVSALMKTMLTDGTMYYVCILLTSTANMLVLRLEDDTLDCIFLVPQSVLHSILCNRLLLRIRDAGSSAKVLVHRMPQ